MVNTVALSEYGRDILVWHEEIGDTATNLWYVMALSPVQSCAQRGSYHRGSSRSERAGKEAGNLDSLYVLGPVTAHDVSCAAVTEYTRKGTHSATVRCVSAKPAAETMYSGCRPNSSLKEAVTSGVIAKPRVYIERPTVAWNSVQLRSLVMPAKPRLYVEALAAKVCEVRSAGQQVGFGLGAYLRWT